MLRFVSGVVRVAWELFLFLMRMYVAVAKLGLGLFSVFGWRFLWLVVLFVGRMSLAVTKLGLGLLGVFAWALAQVVIVSVKKTVVGVKRWILGLFSSVLEVTRSVLCRVGFGIIVVELVWILWDVPITVELTGLVYEAESKPPAMKRFWGAMMKVWDGVLFLYSLPHAAAWVWFLCLAGRSLGRIYIGIVSGAIEPGLTVSLSDAYVQSLIIANCYAIKLRGWMDWGLHAMVLPFLSILGEWAWSVKSEAATLLSELQQASLVEWAGSVKFQTAALQSFVVSLAWKLWIVVIVAVLRSLQSRNLQLKADINSLQSQNLQLQADINDQTRVGELRLVRLRDAILSCTCLGHRNSKLEDRNSKLEVENETLRAMLKDERARRRVAESVNEDLDLYHANVASNAEVIIKELDGCLAELREKVRTISGNWKGDRKVLNRELDSLKAKHSALLEELEKTKETALRAEDNLAWLLVDRAVDKAKLETMRISLDIKEGLCDELRRRRELQ
jgi:hypothetical protein